MAFGIRYRSRESGNPDRTTVCAVGVEWRGGREADTGCMLWMLLDSRLRENDAAGRDSYTLSAWSGVLHFGVEGPGVHAQ